MRNKSTLICVAGLLTRLNGLIKGITVNHPGGWLADEARPTQSDL